MRRRLKMKKIITLLLVLLALSACSGSGKGDNGPVKKSLSFTAYLNEGEEFEFTFDPREAVTYQELRDNIVEERISGANWRSYFDIKEVYREHYEYDEQGNKTSTYQAGNIIMTVLNDEYVYVDNWSRNGLEWEIFVDGEQSMEMTNNGKTSPPAVQQILDIENYSGADAMLIFTDFVDSWDDTTYQKYEGSLNSYDMISCSGDVKLLKSSLISFKKLQDNIYYFAAYESDDDFFVLFVESPDANIDREAEYKAIIYETGSDGQVRRQSGYTYIPVWSAYIELMKKVNE